MRSWLALAMAMLVSLGGCTRGPEQPKLSGEGYLLVWTGDADRQNADFLAVIGADPSAKTYGKVLRTIPVRSRGNEPQALVGDLRDDRRVFASGVLSNRTFVFDASEPAKTRLLAIDEPTGGRRLAAPHALASLPNGHVIVTAADPLGYRGEPEELLTRAGGLIELTADGQFVREIPANDPQARGLIIAPRGVAVLASADRLLTTNEAHGYAGTTRSEWMPGISAQVWRLSDLTLLKTVILYAGARGEENLGPADVRFLHKRPMALIATSLGGALYGSDSLAANEPLFRLLFDFGAGAGGGQIGLTPDDRYLVEALSGKNQLVALDLDDPWHPRPASQLRFDRAPEDPERVRVGRPHGVAMAADGIRIAVADYTVDVPALRSDGDHRLYMVRLDRLTGKLRFDTAFRDELTNEVGLDFNRTKWPHGETGAARPLGMLFVAEAPRK